MRFACVLFVGGFFTHNLHAQETISAQGVETRDDSVRRLYIQDFPDHFFIYPVLKQRTLSFQLDKTDGSQALTFKPNNTFSIGVGAYLFEIGAELVFAVPLNELSRSIYGESDARDIQLNILEKKWGVDAFYQRYSGFYVSEKGNLPSRGLPYPQRADVISRNRGITGYYIFNNRRFSFRAFYNYSERQLQSKGSFLISSILSTFRVSGDSSILTDAQEVLFGPAVSFKELKYTTFSIAPGYTYSLIFKNFFLNGTLSAGPAHHWIRYDLETGPAANDIAINAYVVARIGIGYNGNRMFGGIGFLTRGSIVRFEDVEFSNSNGSFKIVMGYRFREKGILRKRAWDLLPFDI